MFILVLGKSSKRITKKLLSSSFFINIAIFIAEAILEYKYFYGVNF